MASINRVRVSYSGLQGGNGVSTFYCQDAATFLAPLLAMYASLADKMPDLLSITVEQSGDVLDNITGDLTGTWDATGGGPVNPTGNGPYSAPTGCCINWLTSVVVDGARLRGKTFLVPLVGGAFDVDGSISVLTLSALQSAANNFVTATAGNFVVWHRPRPDTHPLGQRDGTSSAVTSAVIRDKAAILRSRRD